MCRYTLQWTLTSLMLLCVQNVKIFKISPNLLVLNVLCFERYMAVLEKSLFSIML